MASEAIVRIEETETQNQALTPMGMIEIAIRQGADIDKLQKLLDLQQRWEAGEARKAYEKAMAAFKADPPAIIKNKHVSYNGVEYDHASLDQVTEKIAHALSKHGISNRWEVEQRDGKIKVTCILTHELGHSERTSLEGEADKTGSKNGLQAIGSSVTYLERYTLLAAVGLAAKNQDDDGLGSQSMGDLQEKLEWIQNARDPGELQRIFKDAYKTAAALKDTRAMQALVAAKDSRRKELQ